MDALLPSHVPDSSPTRVGWDASTLGRERPAAHARRRARAWAHDQWGLATIADSVELVVGELCSNALRHGGGLAGLEMVLVRETMYCPAGVRVLVSDYSPDTEPYARADGILGEQGRGLHLVVALSLRWGWHRLGTDQKQVWCKLTLQ